MLLAAGETSKASTFWPTTPTTRLTEKTCDSSGLHVEGELDFCVRSTPRRGEKNQIGRSSLLANRSTDNFDTIHVICLKTDSQRFVEV